MNIKVSINKKPVFWGLVIGIAVCFLLYFIITQSKETNVSPVYFYLNIIGFSLLLLYVLCGTIILFLNLIKLLFDKEAGLYITDDGIYNNSSINGYKLQWLDISGIEITKSGTQKTKNILIKLVDDNKFLINRNLIQKFIAKKFIKRYKTPVIIPAALIKKDIDELADLISLQLILKHQ